MSVLPVIIDNDTTTDNFSMPYPIILFGADTFTVS